jgi:hypothetical protein
MQDRVCVQGRSKKILSFGPAWNWRPIPIPKIKLIDADYCIQSEFLFWSVQGAPFSS